MSVSSRPLRPGLALAVAALAFAVSAFLLVTGIMPREAVFMTGIFVLAAGWWVTEAVPLFATSLAVLALEIVLLANPGGWHGLGFAAGEGVRYPALLAATLDPVLLLFFGGFILSRAAVKEGADRALSGLLLRPFGSRPQWLLCGVMLATAVFSMWMSNSATAAMMVALCGPMFAATPRGDPFRKALALGVPFAANLGGLGTPIGTPPNAVAMGMLDRAGLQVSFLGWMLAAGPLLVLLLGLVWWLLLRFFPAGVERLELAPAPVRLTRRSRFVMGVFAVTALLWLTDTLHGVPAPVVALIPAVAFTVTGIVGRAELDSLEWNVLLLIAGGLALGAGIQLTGLDRIVLAQVPAGLGSGPLLALLIAGGLLLGTFMSNTAVANLLLPLGFTAAQTAGTSPTGLAVSLALAASLSMALPISTPPNAIAYATGEVTARDMFRVGALLSLAGGVLVLLLGEPLLRLAGVIR